MYSLVLSKSERRQFDHVGHRYGNGYDMYKLLWGKSTQTPDDVDWDYDGDIVFYIPEHVAWEISELADDDNHIWPCFSDNLTVKMMAFMDSIV